MTATITTSSGKFTQVATMYVTGGSIPRATVQALLDSYHAQTYQYLFRGVAMQESGYQQFGTVITGSPFLNPTYGIVATWPDQSPDGRSVGLVQVGPWDATPSEAFDWMANIKAGEDLFYGTTIPGQKMYYANLYDRTFVSRCQGKLPHLTAAQLELVALSYYGHGANYIGRLGAYYVPNKACNQWVTNFANITNKTYVESVLQKRFQ